MRSLPLSALTLIALLVCIGTAFSQVQQSWAQRWTTAGNEAPVAIKTNGSSVYVLAVTNRWSTSADVMLIKYNSAGTFQWVQYYNGPGNNQETASSMVLDGAGNIYVVGWSNVAISNGSSSETFTLKYNSSGTLLWASRYLRPDTYPSNLNSVAVDPAGNVYASGSTIAGAPFAYDFMTIKYNSAGVQEWIRTYNGTGNGVDMDTRVAVDFQGNIVITGESHGIFRLRGSSFSINTYADFYTIKYDPNGNQIWARRYNHSANKVDRPDAMVLDASGNVYITGESSDSQSYNDFLTVKYDINGTLQWASRYNGTANRHDGGVGIVANSAGEVYVTGYSDPTGNFAYNYKTIKYNSGGAQLWEQTYNGTANGTDRPTGIGMDAFGNIYITGESQRSYGYDFATVKYASNGSQQWLMTYNGPGFNSDRAAAIAVYTPTGPQFENAHIYVTGESDGSGTGVDVATIKYTQPLIIGSFASASSVSNYPNPFTSSTTIEFQLVDDSEVTLKVVDVMTGQELDHISLGKRSAGKQNFEYIPNRLRKGNYVYKVIADSPSGRTIESKVMRIDN
jgi:hypothetical protein